MCLLNWEAISPKGFDDVHSKLWEIQTNNLKMHHRLGRHLHIEWNEPGKINNLLFKNSDFDSTPYCKVLRQLIPESVHRVIKFSPLFVSGKQPKSRHTLCHFSMRII